MKKCTNCPLDLLKCNDGHCYCTHEDLNDLNAPREVQNLSDGIPEWCLIKEKFKNSDQ